MSITVRRSRSKSRISRLVIRTMMERRSRAIRGMISKDELFTHLNRCNHLFLRYFDSQRCLTSPRVAAMKTFGALVCPLMCVALVLAFAIVMIISLWKVYEKADQP